MAKERDRERRNGAAGAASLCSDESGATAIEYAIIAGLLSIAIAAVIPEIGTAVAVLLESVRSSF